MATQKAVWMLSGGERSLNQPGTKPLSFVPYLLIRPPRSSARRTWAGSAVWTVFWRIPFRTSARMLAVVTDVCRGFCQSLQQDAYLRMWQVAVTFFPVHQPPDIWPSTLCSLKYWQLCQITNPTYSCAWFQASAAMRVFYAAYNGTSVPTFRYNLSITYSRVPKRRNGIPMIRCVRSLKNADSTVISVEFSQKFQ